MLAWDPNNWLAWLLSNDPGARMRVSPVIGAQDGLTGRRPAQTFNFAMR